MATAIGNSTSVPYQPPTHGADQQRQVSSKNRDGDQNQSKVQEIEKPTATAGGVGTFINTKA